MNYSCRFLQLGWALLFTTLTLLLAVNDPFLGDGHHGTRVVSGSEDLSPAAPLAVDLPAGGVTLQLAADAGFKPGDLLLLHRTVSNSMSAPARDAGAFELDATDLGHFEFVRVLNSSEGVFKLDRAVESDFPASGSQAVLVMEFTDFTITPTGRLFTRPWDGASGGLIALLARGVVRLEGAIDVSGAGSRGGASIVDMAGNGPSTFGCSGLDEPSPRGAFKGESFFSSYFGLLASGSGRATTGGGGGICHNSGGGGGGHAGRGGQGGASWSMDGDRDVGGQGGMALLSSPRRLTFGGGGGAGEAHHGSLNNGGSRGGGIIFLRANSLTGTGSLVADGVTSPDVDDAAGGGGAGGTIYVASATMLSCGRVSVRGGSGGINPCRCEGTSGGGGGGRVVLQADSVACAVEVSAGLGGHFGGADGGVEFRLSQPDFITQPLHSGVVEIIDGGLRQLPGVEPPVEIPRPFVVGCGCDGGGAPFACLLLALVLLKRRRGRVPATPG